MDVTSTADPSDSAAYLELSFAPNAKLVSMVRRFVMQFYREMLSDDAASRTGLATHELLENAVKFSTDQATRLRVEIVDNEGQRSLSIHSRAEQADESKPQITAMRFHL